MIRNRQNPSPQYSRLIENYKKLHVYGDKNLSLPGEYIYAGFSTFKRAKDIKKCLIKTPCLTLLDYGSGKGMQYQEMFPSSKDPEKIITLRDYWRLHTIACYDPAYSPFEHLPEGTFDAVISIDVLEHVHFEDLDWILHEIFSKANYLVYLSVACYPAKKKLPNGENAHSIIRPPKWWNRKISKIAKDYPQIIWYLLCEKNK